MQLIRTILLTAFISLSCFSIHSSSAQQANFILAEAIIPADPTQKVVVSDETYETLKLQARINDMETELVNLQQQIKALDIMQAKLLKQINSLSPPASTTPPVNAIPVSSSEYQFQLAHTLMKDAKFTEAETEFKKFINDYPDDLLVGEAYFWLGEISYKQTKYRAASVHYLKSYKNYPGNPRANDSLFKLSITLGLLNRITEACAGFDSLLEKDMSDNFKKQVNGEAIKFGCHNVN
jgi:tol-pal system protein YbgF